VEVGLIDGYGVEGSTTVKVNWGTGQVSGGHFVRTFGRSPVNSLSHSTQNCTEVYWRLYLRMQDGWTGNPYKLTRATIFATSNRAQAMVAHLWEGPGDTLALDPATGIDSSGQLATTQYNDLAHFTWLGLDPGTTAIFSPQRNLASGVASRPTSS
jgi:hypothetical protein